MLQVNIKIKVEQKISLYPGFMKAFHNTCQVTASPIIYTAV